MDTRLFQDVLVLLEEGSLSAAAARRSLTQPAFSRRIRAFEDWVGIPLLDRTPNRIELHPRLAMRAEEIRATIDRIESLRSILRSGSPTERDFVFSVQHALATTVFPKVLDSFHQIDETITARLRTLNREECISLFVHGEADYLLIYEARGLPPLPFDQSIGRHIWMRDTLIPLCGGHLRYKLGPDNRPKDRYPLITYPAESHFGRLLNRDGLETAMLTEGAYVCVETAFTVAVLQLIQSGQGVGWLPHSMCQQQLASGTMIDLSDAYGQVPLDVSIFYLASDADAKNIVTNL